MAADNVEDILKDSLSFFGGEPIADRDIISYGPLQLTVALKEGKANTLLADHLFSPSLFLAERIERGLIPFAGRTTIELGSGCGLPSLLMATRKEPPTLVVVTDYPDEGILGNLKENVSRNASQYSNECKVIPLGYDWGTDTSHLKSLLSPTQDGFDIVILSDLLHFNSSHNALVKSLSLLLSKSSHSVAYIAAGKYTYPHVCENFIRLGRDAGFVIEELLPTAEESEWLGECQVGDFDKEALSIRKAVCRFWTSRWSM
ncbi:hypothetical protein E1B28_008346 [Marasmius oreades]|uniref:Uncharacterized protein n=1 Tax=Marasmius oreades TaxID=181124 RepID=A0A9P7RYW7_9AGAR|nr:uncharacterized protein E1B28_008346 [Marasmius oreades]KAG7091957.1 hypothetical protein E1B28_008346 [Marasmius oreades]